MQITSERVSPSPLPGVTTENYLAQGTQLIDVIDFIVNSHLCTTNLQTTMHLLCRKKVSMPSSCQTLSWEYVERVIDYTAASVIKDNISP